MAAITLDEVRTALRGMKLADVAYETRLHYNTVRKIANGQHSNPNLDTFNTLTAYIQGKKATAQ
jgi:hypothetical protein